MSMSKRFTNTVYIHLLARSRRSPSWMCSSTKSWWFRLLMKDELRPDSQKYDDPSLYFHSRHQTSGQAWANFQTSSSIAGGCGNLLTGWLFCEHNTVILSFVEPKCRSDSSGLPNIPAIIPNLWEVLMPSCHSSCWWKHEKRSMLKTK